MFNTTPEAWTRHSLLLSRDVVARRYYEFHARKLNAGLAKEIISHLAQAKEYFDSAEHSGRLVRPLLQYYGVLAFSRAIVLFRKRGARESSLVQSHGLTSILSAGTPLSDLLIKTGRGTFEELLDSTSNSERSIVTFAPFSNSQNLISGFVDSKTPLTQSLRNPDSGSTFSLRDLLARIPMLASLFEESMRQRTSCHVANVIIWGQDTYTSLEILSFGVGPITSDELLRRLRLPARTRVIERSGESPRFEIDHKDFAEMHSVLPQVCSLKAGNPFSLHRSFIVEPFADGWSLSCLVSLFVGSFALSTFVRYHPTQWNSLFSQESGDSVLPLLMKLSDVIQAEFPILASQEFELDAKL